MNMNRGIVYLVGAGPGDPALLTLRGAEVMGRADVVLYDHLASARLLDLAPPHAIRICAGKSSGHCTLDQDQINALLLEHAEAGRVIVRLKGGDPLVFGRGAEEAEHLARHGVPFEIIPGVTAGIGVTAYAGIPVTHRSLSSAVAFVTGHGDPEDEAKPGTGRAQRNRLDWSALARFPGTLIVYMGVTHLAAICRTLLKLGKDGRTPAAVVESGTLPAQRVFTGTLTSIAEEVRGHDIHAPALLIVGLVVERRSELVWYESLPLFGQRIVVTRPLDEALRVAPGLEELGAEVLLAPTIQILPVADPGPLDDALRRLHQFDWLVFTSGNGVRFFLERLMSLGSDLRAIGHLKLAAIGPATAQVLSRYHLRADLVPSSYRSEDLAQALASHAAGGRILLARADRGRPLLREELAKVAAIHQVATYQNADAQALPDHVVRRIESGTVDWITLTSSAITTRLHALLPEAARGMVNRHVKLATLSPVTSETVTRLGWSVAAEASVYTWEGLVQAIVERVGAYRRGTDLIRPSYACPD
jgi:uroporphyrinogen III methyltransferase/synthase